MAQGWESTKESDITPGLKELRVGGEVSRYRNLCNTHREESGVRSENYIYFSIKSFIQLPRHSLTFSDIKINETGLCSLKVPCKYQIRVTQGAFRNTVPQVPAKTY